MHYTYQDSDASALVTTSAEQARSSCSPLACRVTCKSAQALHSTSALRPLQDPCGCASGQLLLADLIQEGLRIGPDRCTALGQRRTPPPPGPAAAGACLRAQRRPWHGWWGSLSPAPAHAGVGLLADMRASSLWTDVLQSCHERDGLPCDLHLKKRRGDRQVIHHQAGHPSPDIHKANTQGELYTR